MEAPIHAPGIELGAEDAARLVRVAAESLRIERHYEVFLWLNGELQQLLPHRILVAAWGDFGRWDLKLDVISALPGVRTEALARCRIDDLLREAHARWIEGGREPLLVRPPEPCACSCLIHSALRGMRSLLVHGVRDERSGHESLYLALHSQSFVNGRRSRTLALASLLVAQIDFALRRVAAFPLVPRAEARGAGGLELSTREQEILDWLRQGKTNLDIAAALDISPFTVKNHVQRIFRKIGVRNRTQAAARYSEALRAPDQPGAAA